MELQSKTSLGTELIRVLIQINHFPVELRVDLNNFLEKQFQLRVDLNHIFLQPVSVMS